MQSQAENRIVQDGCTWGMVHFLQQVRQQVCSNIVHDGKSLCSERLNFIHFAFVFTGLCAYNHCIVICRLDFLLAALVLCCTH